MNEVPGDVQIAGNQMNAAEKLMQAAQLEMEAMIHLNNPKRIEETRAKCISAYEVFLDRKIEFFEIIRRHVQ